MYDDDDDDDDNTSHITSSFCIPSALLNTNEHSLIHPAATGWHRL